MENVLAFLHKHRYVLAVVLSVCLLLFVFIDFFVVLALTIAGGISQLYKQWIKIPLGLELMIFATVLIAFLAGPFIAWVCALLMIAMNVLAAQDYGVLPLFRVVMYSVGCVGLVFLLPLGIVTAGITTTVLMHSVYFVLCFFFAPSHFSFAYANAINIAFNVVLFTSVAPQLL